MFLINRSVFLAFVLAFLDMMKLAYGQTSAVVDCRAGCQGNFRGCQESLTGQARLEAKPGRHFDFSTLKITRRSNASDSPGLKQDPKWTFETMPEHVSNPTTIIIRPQVNTCVGNSIHTQGVTFYEWSAKYVNENEDNVSWPSAPKSSSQLAAQPTLQH